MSEERPMSAFAGIAACLALPGPSGPGAAAPEPRPPAVAFRKVEDGRPGTRWLALRSLFLAMSLALPLLAAAQFSIQFNLPGVSIGVNQPVYPQLVPVPGYPVYYDPSAGTNYFFYDGLYWVYQGDNWYVSSWYNGPWALVEPQGVPVFILRVPVRYYRQPPAYFRGWGPDAPPRWGEHWGHDWERNHSGWDQWNRSAAPRPAPLPVYQKQYSGNRYPAPEQQQVLRKENYRYEPRDPVVKQVHQAQGAPPQQQGNKGEQGGKGRPQEQAQPSSRPPQQQASPSQQQQGSKGEQGGKGRPQEQAQPSSRPPQQQQASPPQQQGNKGEQGGKGRPQEQAQPAPRPEQQAKPSSRPPQQQASPPPQQQGNKGEQAGKQQGQAKQDRAPEQDKGAKDKGGPPEAKGNQGQAKGQEHGQEHDR
jgi:hypothetical protein